MGLSIFFDQYRNSLRMSSLKRRKCCRDSKFVKLVEVERVKLFAGTKKKKLAVGAEVKVQLWVVLVPRLNQY
jgi:hypothetical protein